MSVYSFSCKFYNWIVVLDDYHDSNKQMEKNIG